MYLKFDSLKAWNKKAKFECVKCKVIRVNLNLHLYSRRTLQVGQKWQCTHEIHCHRLIIEAKKLNKQNI